MESSFLLESFGREVGWPDVLIVDAVRCVIRLQKKKVVDTLF